MVFGAHCLEVFRVTKLFVGNLPFSATNDTLEELFAQAGTVTTVSIVMDRVTDRSRGFGFVEMQHDQEAQDAIQRLHGQDFQGRPLTVNVAKPREDRGGERRSGFGGERKSAGYGDKGWGSANSGGGRRW